VSTLGPVVDCSVHLWDQRENPVFWLTDRTLVRDLIGNYDSLPDVYTLGDYERETAGFDVRGIVWSDAGAADPVAAAESVSRQHEERGLVAGIVSLGDPADGGFGALVERLRRIPLVRSIRVRVAAGLVRGAQNESTLLEQPAVMEHFALMAGHGIVATIEAASDQLGVVTRLSRELPHLKIVVDHFGWPTDLSDPGRRIHLDRLAELAGRPNVATRLDAIGTIFGAWTTEQCARGCSRPSLCSVPTGACSVPIYRSSGCAPASNACTGPMTRSSPGTHGATARCCCGARRSSGTGPADRTAHSCDGDPSRVVARGDSVEPQSRKPRFLPQHESEGLGLRPLAPELDDQQQRLVSAGFRR
jgi:predicted TIM-barrel fold metal-dependent hydrolase